MSPLKAFLRTLPAVALFVAQVVLSAPANAAPGDLDPTFGVGGRVTTEFVGGSASASSVALQPDGKIVVAGLTGTDIPGCEGLRPGQIQHRRVPRY
jgi:hypothetical protein